MSLPTGITTSDNLTYNISSSYANLTTVNGVPNCHNFNIFNSALVPFSFWSNFLFTPLCCPSNVYNE